MNTAAADTESVISDEDFAKFCEFFYRKTGILFDPQEKVFCRAANCRPHAQDRLRDFSRILHERALRNIRRGDAASGQPDDGQRNLFLPRGLPVEGVGRGDSARSRGPPEREEPVRLWSVPCSSGEEPYSLAIYILEQWADADRYNIEILASDIDSAILAEAAAGVYGERSLQRLSPALIRKYFTELKDRQYRISGDLRSSIDFSQGNVVDPAFMRRFRDIDVIFCRNMLIYFDDKSRRETIEAMYDCLSPGGFICLGHSESMSRISSLFRPRSMPNSIIYQKPFETK